MRHILRKFLLASTALVSMTFSYQAIADDRIKIGFLATLQGSSTVLGEDTVRGAKLALKKSNLDNVELVIKSVSTSPESAVTAAQELVDEGINIIIGPLSSEQGIAIRDFSKTQDQATFINGMSGAVETTYDNPSQNFFRFNSDNVQWSAGLGNYVFDEKKYENVSIVAEDYAFNHAQVFGFIAEFCAAGGKVAVREWVPVGEQDFASAIASIPNETDAIYLGLNGNAALRFSQQYKDAGGKAKFIGSSITVDDALLNAPESMRSAFIEMPSAGPQAPTWGNEIWQAFVQDYKKSFPPEQRFETPSLLATGYYNATSAALACVADTNSEFPQGHGKFRQCLSSLTLQAPNGEISLDENRQAIADNFVSEIIEREDKTLVKKLVRITENVNQTLGLSKDVYDALGKPSRETPECKPRN